MMRLNILVVLFAHFFCFSGGVKNGVEEMYHWREVIFEDLPLDGNTLIGKYPYYIPHSNDVLAMGYHAQSGLMVVTVGRIRPGVPSVLNAFCVSDYVKGNSPHLWGFPDYEKNLLKASFYGDIEEQSRNLTKKHKYSAGYLNYFYQGSAFGNNFYNPLEDFSIVEIYGVKVDDRCNRLFVIDVGILHYSPTEEYVVQNPALIVFELPPNGCEDRKFRVIRRVEIPSHLWKNSLGYLFHSLDYEPKGTCDDVFVYSNTIFDNNILVYDYKHNKFWTYAHPSMNPIAAESTLYFAPNDYHWQLPMGIMSLTLGWPDKDGHRNAYYAPGASTGEYMVSTKLLKNSKRTSNYNPEEFSLIAYRGCESQTTRRVFDLTTGVMFFGEMQSKKIRCWNTEHPLNPDTIGVVFESDALPFVSDIFIDADGYLWFHSNNLPLMFLSGTPLDTTNINSRTFRVKVTDAIKGTVCDTSNHFRGDL